MRVLSAVLVAVLLAAPWLVQSLVVCAWLGVAAALVIVTRVEGRARFFWIEAVTLIATAIAFHWSPEVFAETMDSSYAVGVAMFLPFLVWDATRAALPFWFAGIFARTPQSAWLPAGLLAVVLEAVVPSVFPWRFGYTQIAWPWTLQAVDLFGPGWSTLMVFAHAGAILFLGKACYDAARSSRLLPLPLSVMASAARSSPAVWLCFINLLYSAVAIHYWNGQIQSSPSIQVALVQVDPGFIESSNDLRRLTKTVSRKVDLVCWPESSGGSYESGLDGFSDPERIVALSREPNRGLRPWENPDCELLLAGKLYSGDPVAPTLLYQSAMLIDRQERITGRYHKRHLMPFGEYAPGANWLPAMSRMFLQDDVITSGDQPTVLPAACGAKLGVMLCYEDMVPEAARSLTERSANLLVSLINGSAFPNRLTLAQHRLLAQLRAVECRRYFVRCAATGETCVISPLGEIESSLPVQHEGVLSANVALLEVRPLYCQLGRMFPWLCSLGLAFYVWRATRTRPGQPSCG